MMAVMMTFLELLSQPVFQVLYLDYFMRSSKWPIRKIPVSSLFADEVSESSVVIYLAQGPILKKRERHLHLRKGEDSAPQDWAEESCYIK
jgi:hypothetical protein